MRSPGAAAAPPGCGRALNGRALLERPGAAVAAAVDDAIGPFPENGGGAKIPLLESWLILALTCRDDVSHRGLGPLTTKK